VAPGRLLALACAAFVFLSCVSPLSSGDDEEEEYVMFLSVDETKVSIISGNLTLAITHDYWPRLLFWHTFDPFSPTFDIGFTKLYLFNDTDGDGRFCLSEAAYTVYLDANHVEWNLSSVESGFGAELGKYILFSMSAEADAYNETDDAPPAIESWANVSFWFRLAENDLEYENPAGTHTVAGKTEVFVNMTVDVTNRTEFEYVAVERSVQGGGSSNMFRVLEDGPGTEATAVLSARVDESVEGGNYTRPLNGTYSSTQCIDIAHEDGIVQAFYHWGSEAAGLSGESSSVPVNSSCFTTGTGLMLHSSLPLTNGTLNISLDSSAGIVEEGFVGSVSDWVKELGVPLMIAAAALIVTLVIGMHVVLRRRRLKRGAPGPEAPEKQA